MRRVVDWCLVIALVILVSSFLWVKSSRINKEHNTVMSEIYHERTTYEAHAEGIKGLYGERLAPVMVGAIQNTIYEETIDYTPKHNRNEDGHIVNDDDSCSLFYEDCIDSVSISGFAGSITSTYIDTCAGIEILNGKTSFYDVLVNYSCLASGGIVGYHLRGMDGSYMTLFTIPSQAAVLGHQYYLLKCRTDSLEKELKEIKRKELK